MEGIRATDEGADGPKHETRGDAHETACHPQELRTLHLRAQGVGRGRIDRGRAAERKWLETGVAEAIPAVAPDGGDVGMPLREAYDFYGTARGAVPNDVNGFAVQSFAYTTPFDANGVSRSIKVPTLVVHSENALSPSLARKFIAGLAGPHEELWLRSVGQIDFYDDPQLIARAAESVAQFFRGKV